RYWQFAKLEPAIWLGSAAGLGVLLGVAFAWRATPDLVAAAVELDKRCGLRERVSSALALSPVESESPMGKALLQDAAVRVKRVDVGDKFRVAFQAKNLLPLVPLAAGVLLAFIVPPASEAKAPSQATTAKIDPKALEALDKERIEMRKRAEQAKQQGLTDAEELFKKLEQQLNEAQSKTPKDKQDAMVKLNKLAEEIEQRKNAVGTSEETKQQLDRLKEAGEGPAKKLAEALKDGNFEKAKDELKKLAEQMAKGEMNAEQQKKAAEQIAKMQEKLNQMAQGQKDLKKQLEKQLQEARQNGQQAQAEQMMQQLQKMAEQNPQMEKLKDLADKLGECQECMKNGDAKAAQDKLAAAEDALKQLAADQKEMEMLQEALDKLAEAKDEMRGGNKMQGDKPGDGKGKGKGDKPGDGMGEGRGQGDRPEDKGNTRTVDSSVKQQTGKGSAVVINNVDGPNVRGQVITAVQEAVEAGSSREADPTADLRLPGPYREQAKDYFDRLREGE
ncbi:MAG TPA: hypothetical protein VGE52_20880, partial [Pirellulales bacterium]